MLSVSFVQFRVFRLRVTYYFHFHMSKAKQSTTSRLKSFMLEYGTDIFKTDGTILFYKLCKVKVNNNRKFIVT